MSQEPPNMAQRGLINAAGVGILAAGLIVQAPHAVVAVSMLVESIVTTLLPGVRDGGLASLPLLLSLPPLYQIMLGMALLLSYGAGMRGQPEDDAPGEPWLAGAMLAAVVLSGLHHGRGGWQSAAALAPALLQLVAIHGLVRTPTMALAVYLPPAGAMLLAPLVVGGAGAPWPDLGLAVAIPALGFAIGRLLRQTRLQCGLGSHATLAMAVGFVTAFGIVAVADRVIATMR